MGRLYRSVQLASTPIPSHIPRIEPRLFAVIVNDSLEHFPPPSQSTPAPQPLCLCKFRIPLECQRTQPMREGVQNLGKWDRTTTQGL